MFGDKFDEASIAYKDKGHDQRPSKTKGRDYEPC